MSYCGSIGSVNVLAIMSTDLFDEAQENPFLLQQRSPSPSKQQTGCPHSPQRAGSGCNVGSELPLDDPHQPQVYPGSSSFTPPASPTRKVSFASPTAPRGILKRQSSVGSDASTTPSIQSVTDSELHKLLYSLTRFGLANDADVESSLKASTAGALPDPPTQQFGSNLQWLQQPSIGESIGGGSSDEVDDDDAGRRSTIKRRRSSKKSIVRHDPAHSSRGSVNFATVKNLLRGGGLAGRTAIKHVPVAQRKKSMGTISSRLKVNQKFVRPTILTDAYHRVSEMKLGTQPLKVTVKHVPFPQPWDTDSIYDREEVDKGMPSPKGQLKRNSFISLETLDKIGTRAACPVHLIDEEKPDYSRVSARVDSYNHIHSPKRGLRRPSTWLAGAALDARVAYYEEHPN